MIVPAPSLCEWCDAEAQAKGESGEGGEKRGSDAARERVMRIGREKRMRRGLEGDSKRRREARERLSEEI